MVIDQGQYTSISEQASNMSTTNDNQWMGYMQTTTPESSGTDGNGVQDNPMAQNNFVYVSRYFLFALITPPYNFERPSTN